jgi:hypothetical protein
MTPEERRKLKRGDKVWVGDLVYSQYVVSNGLTRIKLADYEDSKRARVFDDHTIDRIGGIWHTKRDAFRVFAEAQRVAIRNMEAALEDTYRDLYARREDLERYPDDD